MGQVSWSGWGGSIPNPSPVPQHHSRGPAGLRQGVHVALTVGPPPRDRAQRRTQARKEQQMACAVVSPPPLAQSPTLEE